MKLTAIPQLARNANRVREVLAVLSRYGLADWISRLNLGLAKGIFRGSEGRLADLTTEARIRLALTDLGTTFIKFGQIMSTRADLVGLPLATELSKLQGNVPADPPTVVHATILRELGRPVSEIFATFDDVPIASASIAQVHGATLLDGQAVVVKVQHPDIAARIRNDLDILAGLAELADKYVEELRPYQPRAITAEFSRTLLRELDFCRELRNLERFVKNFAEEKDVHFPMPVPHLSTSRILVMERLYGVTFGEIQALDGTIEREVLAKRGARVVLEMLFRDGFFHADPHPGNLLVLTDGTTGVLDVGMVGQLTPSLKEDMEDLLLALGQQDAERLTATLIRLCGRGGIREPAGFASDVADFMGYYTGLPLDKINISGALTEITDIIRRHHLMLPTDIAMLLRVLILLEGTARLLYPQFQLMEMIQPFEERMIADRFSPLRQFRHLRRVLKDWQDLVVRFPTQIRDLTQQLETGRMEVQLQHHHLQTSVNRLVLAMITAALLLGSSILWAQQAPPTIEGISVLGVFGFIISATCAIGLIRAVLRSGNLDG
ncbi:MAG TPA: AarF/ABC1/UbiB kinase family protein [Gemmataceae bacterium]|jgi:ubiquinone biosynthesis protein|nr:AarF/ABC1/UbiB kinase family protein [Gemmataceae bacterium]